MPAGESVQTSGRSSAVQDRDVLLEVDHVKKYFSIEKGFLRKVVGHVRAVDDVSLYIKEGETLGLVGESGSGKTTLGRCILRAIEPTDGAIRFRFSDDEFLDLTKLEKEELRRRRRHMHMIFQDPYSSLDPRMTVLDIVGEPLKLHGVARGKELEGRVKDLMDVVGLETKHLKRYPHAFSGGQRQRIGIARSLALNPKLIVCDEAVSALDVSIQAQILNLLQQLQREFDLTYLFIAHDLSVVEHISDRVAVMYVGRIMEMATTEELYMHPKHPYTEALMSAVPKTDPDIKMDRLILSGEIPNPADPPPGCPFHPRCIHAKEICSTRVPVWFEVTPGHFSACHFARELELKGIEDLSANTQRGE
jgi:peptide/nickel transport system ATP-binding protein